MPLASSTMNRFCMAVLYGRAGRLTCKTGGFRPGQWLGKKDLYSQGADPSRQTAEIRKEFYELERLAKAAKVREPPSWPRNWANFGLL